MRLFDFQTFIDDLSDKHRSVFEALFMRVYTITIGHHGAPNVLSSDPPLELSYKDAHFEAAALRRKWAHTGTTHVNIVEFWTGKVVR